MDALSKPWKAHYDASKNNPLNKYIKVDNIDKRLLSVNRELTELRQDIKKRNTAKYQEEFGDLLYNVIMLGYALPLNVTPFAAGEKIIDKMNGRYGYFILNKLVPKNSTEFRQFWRAAKQHEAKLKRAENLAKNSKV